MTIEIKTPVTREKARQAIEQLNNDSGKKNLKKHFGKLKRNLDGLDYQKQVRDEWANRFDRCVFFNRIYTLNFAIFKSSI